MKNNKIILCVFVLYNFNTAIIFSSVNITLHIHNKAFPVDSEPVDSEPDEDDINKDPCWVMSDKQPINVPGNPFFLSLNASQILISNIRYLLYCCDTTRAQIEQEQYDTLCNLQKAYADSLQVRMVPSPSPLMPSRESTSVLDNYTPLFDYTDHNRLLTLTFDHQSPSPHPLDMDNTLTPLNI